MKLREVIRAVSGFKYEVNEYTVSDKTVGTEVLLISTQNTNIRCLQYGMHHEKMVLGEWMIISKAEFESEISYYRNKTKVIRRPNGDRTKEVKKHVNLSLVDSLILTEHFKERMKERFQVPVGGEKKFLENQLKDHFVVQNYKFYRTNYNEHDPESLVVCSRDFKSIFILLPEGRRYKAITCYAPNDSNFVNGFDYWFQDHLEVIHTMPSLVDYFSGR